MTTNDGIREQEATDLVPFRSPMSETKGFIDVIVISSFDDEDEYQEPDDDDEDAAEESGMKRIGSRGQKKGASGDVSPSSVKVKTWDDKKVDDDDRRNSRKGNPNGIREQEAAHLVPFNSTVSEVNGSIDVIVISSSDDEDEYEESDEDGENEAEELGMKRRGNGGEKKGATGDASPSSVEVKTWDDKRIDDGDPRNSRTGSPNRIREQKATDLVPFSSPMSEIKGSIDLIIISSSDDEYEYQGSGVDDDHEDEAEELVMKKRVNAGEKKGAAGDACPSSVEVKTWDDKRVDDEDCCILDFDPFDSTAADLESKLSLISSDQEEDVSILAAKGEVACRDFPHPRHLCAEFLFDKTSHESYCSQCYCYVCDTSAPCAWWKVSLHSHCHASDQQYLWKNLRSVRLKKEVKSSS